MNNYSIGGYVVGAKGIEMLRGLAIEPLALDGLDGFQKRRLLALAKKGLVTSDAKQATLTAKGTALFTEATSRPKTNGKRAPRKASRQSKRSNGHVPNFTALRAQIVARYEQDLAALDRVIAIQTHITEGR